MTFEDAKQELMRLVHPKLDGMTAWEVLTLVLKAYRLRPANGFLEGMLEEEIQYVEVVTKKGKHYAIPFNEPYINVPVKNILSEINNISGIQMEATKDVPEETI
jgi:hypothetical protein